LAREITARGPPASEPRLGRIVKLAIVAAKTIELRLTAGRVDEGFLQPFAGGLLWCDRPVGAGKRAPAPSPGFGHTGSAFAAVYDGPGLVAGGIQRIRSFVAGDGTRKVEFEDGETFLIAAAGDRVARVGSTTTDEVAPQTLERALGPPMALALAAGSIFLLHASALVGRRGVVAICGDSGAGKSTLAAAAMTMPELGLARVADDQLPVVLEMSPRALPHFPQLKLAPGEWYPSDASASLPLAMVVAAAREVTPPDDSTFEPRLERLDATTACLLLASATVAARLFDRDLLERHLRACAAASQRLQVCRLTHPSGLGRLRVPLTMLSGSMSHASSAE
jgi:hypothetical protein